MTIDRIGGIALFLLAGYVAFETRVLPLGSHQVPGPGYLPLLLAVVLGVLGLLLIFLKRSAPSFRSLKWPEGLHALVLVACCFFATFAIEVLGYRVTMIIVLGFLFGVLERMKIWWVLGLTLGLSFGSYYIFNNVLMVILPRGGLGF
jgi:putative tricarboxylic transport membrane protein